MARWEIEIPEGVTELVIKFGKKRVSPNGIPEHTLAQRQRVGTPHHGRKFVRREGTSHKALAIGIRCRAARIEQTLTQGELARRAEIDRAWLSKMERGKRPWSAEQIKTVEKILGVKLVD